MFLRFYRWFIIIFGISVCIGQLYIGLQMILEPFIYFPDNGQSDPILIYGHIIDILHVHCHLLE